MNLKRPSLPICYILANRVPVPVELQKFVRWLDSEPFDRRVALTELEHCCVSTVFLGVDHNHFKIGPPILFETMAFLDVGHPGDPGERLSAVFRRYSTWQEAEAGHAQCVEDVRRAQSEIVHAAQPALDQLLLRLREISRHPPAV